ncbi:FAD-dependent oxidoreductase [Streptomyces gardneri]|uniref:FAD-dependent oxidoreductase n=1 Tax=Streptomyces gardneri TaxID=66892 RepID=UPI0036819747
MSSIPVPVLKGVRRSGFSEAFESAVDAVEFAKTCKLGRQAERRFWEDDPTGAYNFTEKADRFGRLPARERLDLARESAVELHPEFADDELVPQDKGVTIAWHKVPYQLGGWAAWKPDRDDHRAAYRQLLQPEGDAFHMTGDQISPLPGWQEGAMMSAQYVVQQILSVMPRAVPEVITVPDSAALT